tara:strand:- start:80 stop:850 length:771 start_codon:yes stop_codon:yes gene_type:complete
MIFKPEAMIFDMDGTLTDPRSLISNDVVECLRSLPTATKKYLVTGSNMSKIEEQVPKDILLEIFDQVHACNGTIVYNTYLDADDEHGSLEPELIHRSTLLDHYSQPDINRITSFLLKIAADAHTKYKTGTFVEWRESQINFSLIGRDCSKEQRDDYVKWDEKSKEREKIIRTLQEEFTGWGLSFKIGGQISIDITRANWDKSYAFERIPTSPNQCVFFGDKITVESGNDFEIAMRCAKYHEVASPAELILELQGYM